MFTSRILLRLARMLYRICVKREDVLHNLSLWLTTRQHGKLFRSDFSLHLDISIPHDRATFKHTTVVTENAGTSLRDMKDFLLNDNSRSPLHVTDRIAESVMREPKTLRIKSGLTKLLIGDTPCSLDVLGTSLRQISDTFKIWTLKSFQSFSGLLELFSWS